MKYSIEVLNLVSGHLEEVFGVDGPMSPPSWSPNELSIAYYFGGKDAWRDDSFSLGISEVTEDRWKHRVVAPPSKLAMRSPARRNAPLWGPDGKVLVFEARYQEDERGLSSYVVSTDGTGLFRIGHFYGDPGFHPETGGIVYTVPKEGVFHLDIGTKERRKLFTRRGVFSPKFSPDGKLVAYSDSHGVIFIANSDGSNPRKIVDTESKLPISRLYWVRSPIGSGESNQQK